MSDGENTHFCKDRGMVVGYNKDVCPAPQCKQDEAQKYLNEIRSYNVPDAGNSGTR